ncbi:MAG: aspartyl protease family protein [Candidatus Acidiferrales bacterium]
MPILHSQMAAQGTTPDGKAVQVPPAVALQMRGPVLQVTVTIEQSAGKALLSQGKTAPTKTGFALIDTGASNTCIDEQAAQELGLPVIDVGTMQSASHERHPCNIYPVQIIAPMVTMNSQRTMGANLASQGLLVLIGRDVLQSCNLFYNGPAGQFTLSL